MALEMIVFNVERGLCVFIRTPNNYGILIDCGSSADFSPIDYIKTLPACQNWQGCPLALFILTHPHSDHISDIENLHKNFCPSIIRRQEGLNWEKIRKSNQSNTAFDYYINSVLVPTNPFSPPTIVYPYWGDGMQLYTYALPPNMAEEISSTDSEYANNSSIITILTYKGYCLAITGDILADGMAAILNHFQELRLNIIEYESDGMKRGGVDFYICPHHGHKSGFSDKWFFWAGPTKALNIVSERRKGPNEKPEQTAVYDKYYRDECCLGRNDKNIKVLSTKSGHHIEIKIHDGGNWAWRYFDHPKIENRLSNLGLGLTPPWYIK